MERSVKEGSGVLTCTEEPEGLDIGAGRLLARNPRQDVQVV